jgi:hypothetical protein
MPSGHLTNYLLVLIWVLIVEGLGIYWHAMRASQKLGKILAALEKSDAEK